LTVKETIEARYENYEIQLKEATGNPEAVEF